MLGSSFGVVAHGAAGADRDHDGISDAIETSVDTDHDGIGSYRDIDSAGDRIRDPVEAGANPAAPIDTDHDGTADFLDRDSDNDGIPDLVEAPPVPTTALDIDRDDDGVPDDEQANVVE